MQEISSKSVREAWGWSVPKLATALGISADSVYRWERGESRPTKKRRAQLEVLMRTHELLRQWSQENGR